MAEDTSPMAQDGYDSPMAAGSSSSSDEDIIDTRSLSASVTEYPFHFGRRYHKVSEGSYLYPNDENERDRLDFQYAVMKAIHQGRLLFAPVPRNARRVLDIGTGTGLWPIEVADSGYFSQAKIYGFDLSPIQPLEVPPQVEFHVQDYAERDWHHPVNSIDFIHTRAMLGSFESFSQLIRTARRYLHPGTGWLECQEISPTPSCDDGTMPPDWPYSEWEKYQDRATRRAQRPVRVADKIRSWMEQAGYVDVQEHIFRVPIGHWPKDKELKKIGRAWAENISMGLAGFSYKSFAEGLMWNREEIEVFLANVRNSLKDKSVHAYCRFYVVYGRRPSPEEEARMPPPPRPRGRGEDDLAKMRNRGEKVS